MVGVAESDLADTICYVVVIEFFLVKKVWFRLMWHNLSVAELDLAEMVCGRYGIDKKSAPSIPLINITLKLELDKNTVLLLFFRFRREGKKKK